LDVGDARAMAFNTGALFFGNLHQAAYIVPRDSATSPIFSAALWVGGLVGGEVRAVSATYALFEMWPGPLDAATGRPPQPDDCSDYDRIWRVSRRDVADSYRTGAASPDLEEWPVHLGAPVLDGDGDPGNYDLAAGDQPAISGDQMLWWVMNDVGGPHHYAETAPMGIEVRVSAFALGSAPPALNQTTFYRYQLVYRGGKSLDSAYVGLYADVDLGWSTDDRVGSDTLRDIGIVFNGEDNDGPPFCTDCYAVPPAFGVQVLDGPVGIPNGRDDDRDGQIDESGERLRMSSFMSVWDWVYPQQSPRNGRETYQFLQGRWSDGTPVTEGGGGLNPGSTNTTTRMLAGDPVTPRFWSTECPASPVSCGSPIQPQDSRFMVASGPFGLTHNASAEWLLAMVFAQGTDRLDSVVELRRAATVVRNAYDTGLLEPRRVPGFVGPAPPLSIELRRPAPNPFSDEAVMSVSLPAAAGVRVAMVDVLGREVAVLADGPHEAGPHPIVISGAGLAPGVYVARVWVNGQPAGALPVTRR
jgi:hypothetical protein